MPPKMVQEWLERRWRKNLQRGAVRQVWAYHRAIAMEARQGPDRATGLDGEVATARASQEASPGPSGPRDPDNG